MLTERASIALGTALLLLMSACTTSNAGDVPSRPGQSSTTASPTSTAAPTTTAATTTTTTTTTTTAPTTTTTAMPSAQPEGSGCTPGVGALPDGDWYGIVTETSADELEFDLACWFTGADAVAAAAEDGEEPPPNDYYVRNQNDLIRVIAAATDAEVTWYPDFGDPTSEATTTYADWIELIADRDFTPGVWLEIEDGVIVAIAEQWVP